MIFLKNFFKSCFFLTCQALFYGPIKWILAVKSLLLVQLTIKHYFWGCHTHQKDTFVLQQFYYQGKIKQAKVIGSGALSVDIHLVEQRNF